MLHRLILAVVPVLLAASPGGDRFDARGPEEKWKLRIEGGGIRLERAGDRGKDRDTGRIDTVERALGRVRVTGILYYDEVHPIGGRNRNGDPIVAIESSEEPISIEVIETTCIDAKHRPFPTQVAITMYGETRYRGCGGPLSALEAGLRKNAAG